MSAAVPVGQQCRVAAARSGPPGGDWHHNSPREAQALLAELTSSWLCDHVPTASSALARGCSQTLQAAVMPGGAQGYLPGWCVLWSRQHSALPPGHSPIPTETWISGQSLSSSTVVSQNKYLEKQCAHQGQGVWGI